MTLRLFFIAVICFSQAFAIQGFYFSTVSDAEDAEDNFLYNNDSECKNSVIRIPYRFNQAILVVDQVRELVTSTIVDASLRGTSISPIIICFSREISSYIALGLKISIMVNNASIYISQMLKEKADEYEDALEEPLAIISETLRELPVKLAKYISRMRFLKALIEILRARRIIDSNAKKIGKVIQEISRDIPEMAEKIHKITDDIFETVVSGTKTINENFLKCLYKSTLNREYLEL